MIKEVSSDYNLENWNYYFKNIYFLFLFGLLSEFRESVCFSSRRKYYAKIYSEQTGEKNVLADCI